MMSSKLLCAVLLVVCALKFSSTQSSCRGRCGAEYYRGYTCQCDYSCLSYDECCRDYESACTTKNSCKGRCGETFRRGRLCSCDADCSKFKQCCPDYSDHCDADEISEATSEATPVKTNSCEILHDNKPKESTLAEETVDPFSEGNVEDDYSNPLATATAYPPDAQDQETSPTPESSSGLGPPTADLLDDAPTEAPLPSDAPEFTTERAFSPTETTPSGLFSLYPTAGEATTVSSEASDPTRPPDQGTLPQTTTEEDSNQPTTTSEPTTSSITGTIILPTAEPELITEEDSKQPTTSEPTTSSITGTTTIILSTEDPELTTVDMQDSKTVLETSQVTTSPTETSEATTSDADTDPNKENLTTSPPSLLADVEDPTTTAYPTGAGVPTSTVLEQDQTTDTAEPELTTADPLKITSKPTPKPQAQPDSSKLTPTSKPEIKPVDPQTQNTDNPGDYQGDDNNDPNLCSGRPVSGVTTLRNGTMVVFRGHYFWFLDRNHVPSPPRGITQVWGVPSPIDTVFTRCNCQGKTYIFKGGKYWRFENDSLDPGYPKLIKTGFDGLRGHITAALSVPQHQSRKESVYFFKRGGFVQKYSYQFGTSPTCGGSVRFPVYTVRARLVRQAVSVLEPEINIRKSWRGFPHTITAAVSIPSTREPDGYKYVVFSRSTSYNVRMTGERPVITVPKPNTSSQSNTFFKCQKP